MHYVYIVDTGKKQRKAIIQASSQHKQSSLKYHPVGEGNKCA